MCLTAAVVQEGIDLDISGRLSDVEEDQRNTRLLVSRLDSVIKQQNVIIASLDRKVSDLRAIIDEQRQYVVGAVRLASESNKRSHLSSKLHKQDFLQKKANDCQYEKLMLAKEPEDIHTATRNYDKDTRKQTEHRRQVGGGIAFSVYLDHDETLASHQTVKFNQVLLNEGNGYSPQTGIFECQEGGVYMFTFAIGQRDANHYMWAELMLNGKNVIDAVVDTYHQYQDLQGGNTAILRLSPGDRVWIDATHNGSHVEGSGSLRLTSFSGLFLYN